MNDAKAARERYRGLPRPARLDSERHSGPVLVGLVAIFGLAVAATVGYVLIEDWTVLEAIYMVAITLSTVGFREVHPLSPAGRVLTTGLIFTGVAAFAYVAVSGFRLMLEGELRRVVGRRRMDKEIARLTDHMIVCGFGRVGQEVCRNLVADGVPLVVVEEDDEQIRRLDGQGLPFIRGDATEETTLIAAGLHRARGVLLTLSYEADNVYVTLIAKDSREEILVIARSVSPAGERRLKAAGADRVISPERIGARSMSNSVSRPNAVDFTEIVTARDRLSLEIDEQRISGSSRLVGKTIRECEIRRKYGLIVVGIVTADGETLFNPEPGIKIDADSTLVILGEPDDVRRFADSVG